MQENSLAWEKCVVGSVGINCKTYLLSLSLINAQTGKIENAAEDKCKCEVDGLIDSSKNLARGRQAMINKTIESFCEYH